MTRSADAPCLCDRLRSETREYERMAALLQSLLDLFAGHDHAAVEALCDDLLALARDLPRHALERNPPLMLKPPSGTAENMDGPADPAVEQAYCELLAAQNRARLALTATLESARDLATHAAALRASLLGRGSATYDARGKAG